MVVLSIQAAVTKYHRPALINNKNLLFLKKILFSSNLFTTQCGTGTRNIKIRSHVLFKLSQPGAPRNLFLTILQVGKPKIKAVANLMRTHSLIDPHLLTNLTWQKDL